MRHLSCLLSAIVLTSAFLPGVIADDKKDEGKVVFLVKTDFVFGQKDVDAIKDGKCTDMVMGGKKPKEVGLKVSAIKLEGQDLPTGDYEAIDVKCKRDGKDQTYIFFFPKAVDEKVKLTNVKFLGEAKADYKTANAGYKDAKVFLFEATPAK
jgi:hypothetical protein